MYIASKCHDKGYNSFGTFVSAILDEESCLLKCRTVQSGRFSFIVTVE
jgi:hypothetical protein